MLLCCAGRGSGLAALAGVPGNGQMTGAPGTGVSVGQGAGLSSLASTPGEAQAVAQRQPTVTASQHSPVAAITAAPAAASMHGSGQESCPVRDQGVGDSEGGEGGHSSWLANMVNSMRLDEQAVVRMGSRGESYVCFLSIVRYKEYLYVSFFIF